MNNEDIEILEDKKKGSKRPYVIAIALALLLVVTITATSYAYFTGSVTNSGTINNTVVTTTSLQIEFTDGPTVGLENALPGTYVTKTFKVENKGSGDTTYDVYMSDLINDFADKTDLVYTLTSADGGANVSSQTQVPATSSKIVNSQLLRAGETHNYTLRIDFLETNDNQDDNKGKTFSTIIRVNEVQEAQLAYSVESGDLDTVGSVVKITDEEFYVIGQEDSNHVKLLSKWNLNVGDDAKGTATGLQDEDVRGYMMSTSLPRYGIVEFSNTNYWHDTANYKAKDEYGGYTYSRGDYLDSSNNVVFPYVYDDNASIKTYVDNYVTYLTNQGARVTGRLIKHEEVVSLGCVEDNAKYYCSSRLGGTAPEWVYQTDYWTGSACYEREISIVNTEGRINSSSYGSVSADGVRPVIILEK